MARIRVDPLNIKFPIVNPKTGTPSPAFMRLWQNLFGNDDDNADTIQDVIKDLRDNVIEAADGTIDVTGSGSLLDGPVKLAADTQAILNKLSSTQGSVLYRDASTWSALGPGTSGYVLTTGGPGANVSWAAGAPVTPALTNGHIFVGNASNIAGDVAMSGDASVTNTGALSVNNLSHVANGSLANTGLANSSLTLNSHSVSLGGSLTLNVTDIFSNWSVSGGVLTQARAGGTTAEYIIQGEGTVASILQRNSANANGAQLTGQKSRGTNPTPSAAAQNDAPFQVIGSGYGTTGFQPCATLRFVIEEPTPSDTAMGGSFRLLPTALGSTTATEVFRALAANQQILGPVRIGSPITTVPAGGFHLDLVSTIGALGFPSMTTTQKNALNSSTPVNRMAVYDSTLNKFQFYENGAWASLGGSGSWTITDGTNSVAGVTTLTVTGGTVSGTSPNATLTVTGSGYAPGTPPTEVQFASSVAGGNSVVFGSAPTSGNLLVAMCFNPTSQTAGTGWTVKANIITGTDFGVILTKTAGAGESTTQSPLSGVSTTGCMAVWELHGSSGTPTFILGQTQAEQSGTISVPILFPNIVNCIGLSALGAVTNNIAGKFNVGTQDVLDNTNANRKLVAGHTDLSKTPMVGVGAFFATTTSTKSATCLISS